jgi:hypothetical protein
MKESIWNYIILKCYFSAHHLLLMAIDLDVLQCHRKMFLVQPAESVNVRNNLFGFVPLGIC